MITPNVPINRMTLRQLMTHAEKLARDVNDYVTSDLLTKLSDLHELSRPVRRKSQYPTISTLRNSVQHVDESLQGLIKLMTTVQEHLEAISQQAQRGRSSRR
jgi:hypothetical protein